MLKPDELVDKINILTRDIKSVELIFISRHSVKGYSIYESHYPVLGRNLNDQIIKNIVFPLGVSIQQMGVEEYDPVLSAEDCIQYIDINKVGEADKIITAIDGMHTSEDFSIQSIDNGRLLGYCIKLSSNAGDIVYLFKKLTNSKLLEKKRFLCCFMGPTLEKMTSQPLAIDERIDCLAYNNGIYIFNNYYFEILFKINDEYRKKVDSILKTIEKYGIIANMESFAVECKNTRPSQRRLIKIANSEFKALAVLEKEPEKMIGLIEQHNLLLEVSNDGKIIYNEGDSVEPILRLIDGGLITVDIDGTKGYAPKLRKSYN